LEILDAEHAATVDRIEVRRRQRAQTQYRDFRAVTGLAAVRQDWAGRTGWSGMSEHGATAIA
jgi:hypothetical protein